MIRRHYLFPAVFMSPDAGGASAGDSVAAGEATPGGDAIDASGITTGSAEATVKADANVQTNENSSDSLNAEIARLKAEMAKQKNALDKATHEASEARKSLKAKMTQEEIDAASKQEADEKAAKELEDLRREVAKGKTVKSVMGKLGLDEDTAGNLADALYGATDIDNALLSIQKAWQIREKALRLEYGKITGPGAGADGNSPEAQAVKRAAEIGKARNAQNEQAQKAMNAYMR